MVEYGSSFEHVMAMPIARAYGLMNCYRKRMGGKFAGPDYRTSDTIERMKRVKRNS